MALVGNTVHSVTLEHQKQKVALNMAKEDKLIEKKTLIYPNTLIIYTNGFHTHTFTADVCHQFFICKYMYTERTLAYF